MSATLYLMLERCSVLDRYSGVSATKYSVSAWCLRGKRGIVSATLNLVSERCCVCNSGIERCFVFNYVSGVEKV